MKTITDFKAFLTAQGIDFAANATLAQLKKLVEENFGDLEDANREFAAMQANSGNSAPKSIFDKLDEAREARNIGAEKITKVPFNPTIHDVNKLKLGMDDKAYPFKTTFGEVLACTEFKSSRNNTLYNFTIEVDGVGLAYATGQKELEIGTFVKFQAKHLDAGQYAERDKDGKEVVLTVPQGRTICYQPLIGVKKVTKESLETTILIKHAKDSGALV